MGPELHARFAAAVEAALAGATVVTSTTRASRTILAEALRRLRVEKPAVRTPDVLPIEAFWQRLWSDALIMGAGEQALLSDARAHALWRKAIGQTRRSILSLHGSARSAQDAWRTARAYRIRLDKQAFRGAESEAFLAWASLYIEECRRGKWVDAADLPDALMAALGGIQDALPKRLVVYGFEVLSPQTSDFLATLRKHRVTVETIGIDAPLFLDSTQSLRAPGADTEFELAARWTRRLLRDNEARRIGVVVPRLREVQSSVEATFAAVLHPEEFLSVTPARDRVFEIAVGRPLNEYALVRDALVALRFVFAEAPIADVGMLLRSPYFDETTESAERAMFDATLRKYGRARYSAASLIESPGSTRIVVPPKLARRIRKMGDLRRADRAVLTPSEAAELFHKTLEAANWPARELDSAEYQLREKWADMLAEFASLDGFVPTRSAAELVDELSRMMTVAFRPQNTGAPVQIMDEDEAAGLAFDALWVCGMTDDWPRHPRANPYLPLALQRAAGVPDLTPEQQHASAERAIARFTASANEVVLSWAEHEKDRDLRASRMIEQFPAGEIERLCGTPTANVIAMQRATAALEWVNDQQAPAADAATLPHRGTELLKYQAHCPFRAFAQLRLGAQKLESPELGLNRRVRGNLVETALQEFWAKVRNSHNLNGGIRQPEIDAAIADAVEKAFQKCAPPTEGAWDERLRELERRRLRTLLVQWLEVEKLRTPFEVMEHQKEINAEIGPLKIHGFIDRLDRVRGQGFVVIDYKSGRTKPSIRDWHGDRPEEPQVPIYAVHVGKEHELSGAGLAHVSSVDTSFRGCATDRQILVLRQDALKRYFNGRTIADQVVVWDSALKNLAAAFASGGAAVDPKHPPTGTGKNTCERCHVQALCRVAEMSFTDGDDADGDGGDDE